MTFSHLSVVSMLPSGVFSLSLSLSLALSRITFVSRKVVLGVDLMEVVIGSHPCLTRIKGCPKRGSRPSVPLYFSSLISCSSFVLLVAHFVPFICAFFWLYFALSISSFLMTELLVFSPRFTHYNYQFWLCNVNWQIVYSLCNRR